MADAALADGAGYSFHTWWMSYPIVSGMPPLRSRESPKERGEGSPTLETGQKQQYFRTRLP